MEKSRERLPKGGSGRYFTKRSEVGGLGASWVPLGGLVGRLGRFLGASWGDLGVSCGPRGATSIQNLGNELKALQDTRKKKAKELKNEKAKRARLMSTVLLGRLGCLLGASWGVLGGSWGPLGATWVPLGGLVGPLGATWGRPFGENELLGGSLGPREAF